MVIRLRDCYRVTIEHTDHNKHRSDVTPGQLRRGAIRNPYKPRIFGVGFTGVGIHAATSCGRDTRPYTAWVRMLERAYSTEKQKTNKSYIGCAVAAEWHNFQNFADWYASQPFSGQGFQVDKDILLPGNKIYCAEFCRLVPARINKILLDNPDRRGAHPVGVTFYAGKYVSHLSRDGRRYHLGRFATPEEAFKAYKAAREDYIISSAERDRDSLPLEIYEALMRHKISIND